ncbi:MAG: hypothetical protein HQL90_07435 [Magnetococcales bacterium]|nr:hypothetical protein [Magnetococcales bacterium]
MILLETPTALFSGASAGRGTFESQVVGVVLRRIHWPDARRLSRWRCSPSHWPDEMRLSRWWLVLFSVALAGRDAFESLVVGVVFPGALTG